MQDKHRLLEALSGLLKHKQSRAFYASKLGISEKEVRDLMDELKQKGISKWGNVSTISSVNTDSPSGIPYAGFEIEKNEVKGEIKASVVSDRALTIDELVEFHKIDTTKYKIGNYWSIFKNGKFHSSLYASLKKPTEFSPEDFANFLKTYTPSLLPRPALTKYPDVPTVDVELSLSDFHLAKKTIDGETFEQRKERWVDAVSTLISNVGHYNIRKIVFPISNDFFHSDTYNNTTTNGTPQDTLVDYNQEYEDGFDLLVSAIWHCSVSAEEVEVILVQGNHDRTKAYYVAHALEVFFSKSKNVTFQRHHSTTKYTTLGNTFIGYHHGNCKIDDLPLLFATGDSAVSFGVCKYREVHTGDKHHYMAKEVKGVRIQQMPSLSGTDRWHNDNNYVNSIRAGLILIYHPEKGKIGEFEYRI